MQRFAKSDEERSANAGKLYKLENAMNRTIVEGNWRQLKGIALQKWGRFVEDDFLVLEGRQEYWAGEMMEARGMALDKSRRLQRSTAS